jgi:hypothetical protein
MQKMPNDVAAKLRGLVMGSDASSDYGLMPYKTWPNYPNSGVIQASITYTPKWDAKFNYYVNNQKVERDAFSVRFHYMQVDSANGETPTYDGMPIAIPYDTSGLPDKTLKQVEMRIDRLATCMMNALQITAAEWKAEFTAGGWARMFELLDGRIERATANGTQITCKVELIVRKYDSKNQTTNVVSQREDGEDIIRECTNPPGLIPAA